MQDQDRLKDKVRAHFGQHAEKYLDSKIHSSGESLEILVDITKPGSDWQMLDVAAGTGNTGFAFSSLVEQVTALDITFPMLQIAKGQAEKRQTVNFEACQASSDSLPFADGVFHLITCRIAAHHFRDPANFLSAACRCLRPGGKVAVVDNIAPSSVSKRRSSPDTIDPARYVNAFERLRDPGHNRCLTMHEWIESFFSAGLRITHKETVKKDINFSSWVRRSGTSPEDTIRLKAMLHQAPDQVKEFLQPRLVDGELYFTLTEGIILAEKTGS